MSCKEHHTLNEGPLDGCYGVSAVANTCTSMHPSQQTMPMPPNRKHYSSTLHPNLKVPYSRIWRFPRIRGTMLGVPIIRIRVCWGLYWGPLVSGSDGPFLLPARPPGLRALQNMPRMPMILTLLHTSRASRRAFSTRCTVVSGHCHIVPVQP